MRPPCKLAQGSAASVVSLRCPLFAPPTRIIGAQTRQQEPAWTSAKASTLDTFLPGQSAWMNQKESHPRGCACGRQRVRRGGAEAAGTGAGAAGALARPTGL